MSTISQDDFTAAQQTIQAVVAQYNDGINTKKGAVVRQLIVRPAAYIYAWIRKSLDTYVSDTSISQLSVSQATSNQLADMVASNYFITRRQGGYARGLLTITMSTPTVRIPVGTSFLIDGIEFIVAITTVASTLSQDSTATLAYAPATTMTDGTYKANISITAKQTGYIQIPSGAQVTYESYISGLQSVQLTSAITGGGDIQTDAQMMARAKQSVAAATTGTANAIYNKLQEGPVAVLSAGIVGGQEASAFRARNNNIQLSRGGMVDVFVKTQNQLSRLAVPAAVQANTDTDYAYDYKATVNATVDTITAGAVRVHSLATSQGQGIAQYQAVYTTDLAAYGAAGARLSPHQQIVVYFSTDCAQVSVDLEYMPGIYDLQQFMDLDDNAFLGLDTMIKAAVPVTIDMTCVVSSPAQLTEDTLLTMRQTLAGLICDYPVGTSLLNFSDIKQSFQAAYPQTQLRLPCTFSVAVPTLNGGIYTFTSQSGIVDLSYRKGLGYWDNQTYFFSSTASNIRLTT